MSDFVCCIFGEKLAEINMSLTLSLRGWNETEDFSLHYDIAPREEKNSNLNWSGLHLKVENVIECHFAFLLCGRVQKGFICTYAILPRSMDMTSCKVHTLGRMAKQWQIVGLHK